MFNKKIPALHRTLMPIATAAAIPTTARVLQPIINDIYARAKKVGVAGVKRWEARTFPAKLARRIRSLETVKTLWKPEGGVSLLEFYHPPKIKMGDKPTLISRLSELGSENLIIEGIVGQGKSILLRSLAIQEILSNDARRLPLFLELRTLSAKLPLREAIAKQLESYDIDADNETINYIFRSGKISILLDGFDELDESLIKDTLQEIDGLTQKYPELQFVITSRPGNEIQKNPAFKIVKIEPLRAAEIPAFLDKLGVSAAKSVEIRQAIKISPSKVSNLITTPLMLTLVVIVYESESEIPETLPEFFERLFQVVFSRHDRMKAGFERKHYSGLSERKLQALFEAFCFMTIQLGHPRTLSAEQFAEVFDLALTYTEDCGCEVEKFKKDISKVACLMLEEGVDSITFLHKSILEYYAASFIKRLDEESALLFYGEAVKSSSAWEEVLFFLKAIDSYRYSPHYVLPTVQNLRATVANRLVNSPEENLPKIIADSAPEIGIYYRTFPESSKTFTLSAFGPIQPWGNEIGKMNQLLVDAFRQMAPLSFSGAELQETLGPYDVDAGEIHIPITKLAQAYGTSEIKKAVAIFDERLKQAEAEASTVVASQERKKLIFSKPPKRSVGAS